MSINVAVAGGSNGLGRTIVEALKKDGRYEVIILSRQKSSSIEKQSGVRVVVTDYTNVDALRNILETNNVSILISTANSLMDPTPEFNMIEAANESSVTNRFIPNAWSALEFKDEPKFQNFAIAKSRLQTLENLKKTNLEWTAIYPGLFMEIAVEGLPSHLNVNALMIDVVNNAAGLPNQGEASVSMTYSRDIATYVVKLLGIPKWEQSYHIYGDVKTWNQIVAAAEAGKGVRFDVSYDSIELLQQGTVTELPGHAVAYKYFGGRDNARPILQGLFAQYGIWMEEGLFTYQNGALLNELFPEIQPLKLDQAWKAASGS